jgi:hypothetical protein
LRTEEARGPSGWMPSAADVAAAVDGAVAVAAAAVEAAVEEVAAVAVAVEEVAAAVEVAAVVGSSSVAVSEPARTCIIASSSCALTNTVRPMKDARRTGSHLAMARSTASAAMSSSVSRAIRMALSRNTAVMVRRAATR